MNKGSLLRNSQSSLAFPGEALQMTSLITWNQSGFGSWLAESPAEVRHASLRINCIMVATRFTWALLGAAQFNLGGAIVMIPSLSASLQALLQQQLFCFMLEWFNYGTPANFSFPGSVATPTERSHSTNREGWAGLGAGRWRREEGRHSAPPPLESEDSLHSPLGAPQRVYEHQVRGVRAGKAFLHPILESI